MPLHRIFLITAFVFGLLPLSTHGQGGPTLNDVLDNAALNFATGGDTSWQMATGGSDGDYALANLTTGKTAWIETTVTGPGWLGFEFYADSPRASYVKSEFSVDGVVRTNWGAQQEIAAGPHRLRWQVWGLSLTSVTGSLNAVTWQPFTPTPLAAVLPPAGAAFSTSVQHPWFATNWPLLNGSNILRMPGGLTAGSISWLEAAVTGPVEVTFQAMLLDGVGTIGSPAYFTQENQRRSLFPWPPFNPTLVRTAIFAPGPGKVRWECDGGYPMGVGGISLSPLVSLEESLDAPGLTWTNAGAQLFYGVNRDGRDVAAAAQGDAVLTTQVSGPAIFRMRATSLTNLPEVTHAGATGAWLPRPDGWQEVTLPVPPGQTTVRITDTYISELVLDEVSVQPVLGHQFSDGLRALDQTWITSSQNAWSYSSVPGAAGPDSAALWLPVGAQEAWLETTIFGPGVVAFSWRAPPYQPTGGWLNHLLVDGHALVSAESDLNYGNSYWKTVAYALPAGRHTLRWLTQKTAEAPWLTAEMSDFSFIPGSFLHEATGAAGVVFPQPAGTLWSMETHDTVGGGDALRFTAGSPHVQADLPGPGRLRFSWKGPAGGPAQPFWATGVSVDYSTPGQWQSFSIEIPPDPVVAEWDKQGAEGCLLDNISWVPDQPASLAGALDGSNLTWTTDPAHSWQAWSRPGTTEDYAAPAPSTQTMPGTQPLTLQAALTGPGYLSFTWQDGREFLWSADGDILLQSRGNTLATTANGGSGLRTLYIPPGPQNLTWSFQGYRARKARLDRVNFKPLTVVTPATATDVSGLTWRTNPSAPWIAAEVPDGIAKGDEMFLAPVTGTETWVEADVTGPGVLDFWLLGPLEYGESWRVLLDGKLVPLPGSAWPGIYVQEPGLHTIRWTYRANRLPVTPFGLDDVTWTPAGSKTLASGMDAASRTFTTGGPMPWKGTAIWTRDGNDAAFSGSPRTVESAWMETTVTGPATVSFFWQLNHFAAAASPSLSLLVDGVEAARAIDREDINDRIWSKVQVALISGNHTLRWVHQGSDMWPQSPDMLEVNVHPDSGAWVDNFAVSNGSALTGALEYSGAISATGDVAVITGGSAHDGQDALALGSTANSSGSVTVPVSGPGLVGFWWKAGGALPSIGVECYLSGYRGYFSALASTDGLWHYATLPLTTDDVTGAAGVFKISCTRISETAAALIDGLTFTPLGPSAPLTDALDFPAAWTGNDKGLWTGIRGRNHDGTGAAWSATTPETKSAVVSAIVTGPGTLTFFALHEGTGSLKVKVRGSPVPGVQPGNVWSQHSVSIGSGAHDIAFVNTPGDGLSTALVDEFTWTPGPDLTAATAADAPGFTWATPALNGWFPIASLEMGAAGGHAMIHTTALNSHPSNFRLSAPLTTSVTGPGVLRFRWRFMDNYVPPPPPDYSGGGVVIIIVGATPRVPELNFLVDGLPVQTFGGPSPPATPDAWFDAVVNIPAGTHEAAWQFHAGDFSYPAPDVTAVLDAVTFQPGTPAYASWISGYFNDSARQAASADPDGDGIPSAVEWAAGTSPASGTSRPELRVSFINGHPRVSMPLVSQPGVTLCAETSSDLLTWSRTGLTDLSAVTPGFFTVEKPDATATTAPLFFRVCAELTP